MRCPLRWCSTEVMPTEPGARARAVGGDKRGLGCCQRHVKVTVRARTADEQRSDETCGDLGHPDEILDVAFVARGLGHRQGPGKVVQRCPGMRPEKFKPAVPRLLRPGKGAGKIGRRRQPRGVFWAMSRSTSSNGFPSVYSSISCWPYSSAYSKGKIIRIHFRIVKCSA